MFSVEDVFAQRIGGKNFGKDTTIYKFEKSNGPSVRLHRNAGVELLDMGVGERARREILSSIPLRSRLAIRPTAGMRTTGSASFRMRRPSGWSVSSA